MHFLRRQDQVNQRHELALGIVMVRDLLGDFVASGEDVVNLIIAALRHSLQYLRHCGVCRYFGVGLYDLAEYVVVCVTRRSFVWVKSMEADRGCHELLRSRTSINSGLGKSQMFETVSNIENLIEDIKAQHFEDMYRHH